MRLMLRTHALVSRDLSRNLNFDNFSLISKSLSHNDDMKKMK